jgi:hypothetical protein
MKLNITKGYQIYIDTFLFDAGRNEFGEVYEAESYHVALEREDGMRLYHPMPFPGVMTHVSDDGFIEFEDIREEAKKEAQKLVDRVMTAGVIETGLWYEGEPSYGSEYFRKVKGL